MRIERSLRRLLGVFSCAALLLALLPAPARALTLTAVNDTLLPLSDSTMPARLGGELYVPYSVFSSLGVASSIEDGVLDLSAAGQTLSFSPDEGYVYDQDLNSYATPAYRRNGTVYVPVKLCCGKFGLGYSTISVAGETVLRVTDGNAQSDPTFASARSKDIERAIRSYRGLPAPSESPSGGDRPTVPNDPPLPEVVEQPTQKPARVYLTFYGAPTAHTPAILDALRDAGRTASFFLPTDTALWTDDTIRRIAAEGHALALLLDADAQADPAALLASLDAANARLRLLTGLTTRLLSNEAGCAALSTAQRDALTDAGYRLWDATLDSGDETRSAARAYALTAQQFAQTDATVVLALHHSRATAQTVQSIAAYMARLGIPASRITLRLTPLNSASDLR
ncbi:MAG: polysaccharide deacetylase family protein [Eubacteriales bacterium]|nr:polysaccharide deacetylase family protein [Eubacteriales bacterium]